MIVHTKIYGLQKTGTKQLYFWEPQKQNIGSWWRCPGHLPRVPNEKDGPDSL